MTLLGEMASFLPSQLEEELNIYFVYRNAILSAENDYNDQK